MSIDHISQRSTTHIELLSGEWPTANASSVCFHDADDFSDATWRNAQAGADAADGRRAARHERISSIVDVEHQRVRALDEDALSGVKRLMYIHDAVNDEGAKPFRQSLQSSEFLKKEWRFDRQNQRCVREQQTVSPHACTGTSARESHLVALNFALGVIFKVAVALIAPFHDLAELFSKRRVEEVVHA